MKLINLQYCFENAKRNKAKYMAIKIQIQGYSENELIIISHSSFEKKLKYYEDAYTEDLRLKSAPDKVQIVGFTYGYSLADIEKDLIQ